MGKLEDRKGNTAHDQRWLAAVEEAGKLEILDDDAPVDALPFGARMRFDGDPRNEGSPFHLPQEGQRCKGKAYVRDAGGHYVLDKDDRRIYRQCMNWPIRGGAVCIKHGGGIPRVLQAAKMRLLASADIVTGSLIHMATDSKVSAKERIQACNSILDRVGVKAGVDVTVEVKPWQDLLQSLQKQAGAELAPADANTIDLDEDDWDEANA